MDKWPSPPFEANRSTDEQLKWIGMQEYHQHLLQIVNRCLDEIMKIVELL